MITLPFLKQHLFSHPDYDIIYIQIHLAETRRKKMEIIKYYGSDTEKKEFINHDNEPLIAAIAHDGSHAVVSLLDEGCEHHLLLAKTLDRHDIDKYFKIIFDDEGADWTFVCPPDYKGITNKEKRIAQFYNNGINVITDFLHEIGYEVPINIPKRYQRHFNYMTNADL